MLQYMDYVLQAFYKATDWNEDNSYANLNATAKALLDFQTPRGLKLYLSSLSSPNFATSYNLANSGGVVDGFVSYLYSSLPLNNVRKSRDVALHDAVPGYRQLEELKVPEESWYWEVWHQGRRVDKRDSLLYGKMYLPTSALEILYLRRLSPTRQLLIKAVSDTKLKNGGTILTALQKDCGRWSAECLYSTSEGLIGARGLYNFGDKLITPTHHHLHPKESKEKPLGRISVGAELYYGLLNKSGGISTGVRYTTLPAYTGVPLTMTLVLNPLMGHLSATYAVKGGPNTAFCSKFDFNIYSYESDLVLGCEIWRQRSRAASASSSSLEPGFLFEDYPDYSVEAKDHDDGRITDFAGCLKARWAASTGLGLLWEGRIKHLLFSIGSSVDFRRKEMPVKSVGVELMYSS